ncbi:MAG: MTAP family purine nucleoside phosphorylase [Acidimicrobiales bacterium]|nr:MTAP family purine nucleoside phosphorylase [Acidimicrobiales bacterium]
MTTAGGLGLRADVGVYGGSGLYSLLDDVAEVEIDTPYGPPAAPVTIGEIAGRRVAFLARHGRDHALPPHRVPYRANAWAMRELGVRALFGPCASGSLQPDINPGDFVIADQIVDRTWGRASSFHDGPGSPDGFAPVDHVSFADPYDARLRSVAVAACHDEGVTTHDGGTVVVVDRVSGDDPAALLRTTLAAAAARGDVLAAVVAADDDEVLEGHLADLGFDRTVDVYAWP